jgi:phosphatidylinositol alpha-mannosyltransferase
VTRHIDALAHEFLEEGHHVRVLAPFDPADRAAAVLHRGARPQPVSAPDYLIPLGRTVGFKANGAVSNLALTPYSLQVLHRELRTGGYDVVHIHEPVAPVVGWDALCSLGELPLVGTFHTYSENVITNGIAAIPLGGRRRMNRLHVRIAVSEAAAWTARRFYGGHYRIVPNGVHIPAGVERLLADEAPGGGRRFGEGRLDAGEDPPRGEDRLPGEAPLRILFIGQAVARKGLPVLLRAFEALREQVPATLTLVGAGAEEIRTMLLDDRGVRALGKVSDERKAYELARAHVLCAPSLSGESFGMVLTEGFAASTPVVASDIAGYRDVVRDGVDGVLVPPDDPLALAEALRGLALDRERRAAMARRARERAERFAWPRVAAEVLDCYEQATSVGRAPTRLHRAAVRHGLAPADLRPRAPARRLPSLQPAPARRASRAFALIGRLTLLIASLLGAGLAFLALERIGLARVLESLVASSPGLVAVGVGLMCASMLARAFSWHAILAAAPTWRKARRRDALQGTFIGVLMSATLPARLGEPSRALIVARRLGRARDTLPVVLGTMVSQTLLNLLALTILGAVMFSTVDLTGGEGKAVLAVAFAPVAALLALFVAPALMPSSSDSRSARLAALLGSARDGLLQVRSGLLIFGKPRQAAAATAMQLAAWALQWLSCWFLSMALGLSGQAGIGAAAAVLFAVNVTAIVPATPANVGVFQAACLAVLGGAYHVATPSALAYGILLQAVEVATALLMGMPALVKEGLSWKEVRMRTMHASPVSLPPLPRTWAAKGRVASP